MTMEQDFVVKLLGKVESELFLLTNRFTDVEELFVEVFAVHNSSYRRTKYVRNSWFFAALSLLFVRCSWGGASLVVGGFVRTTIGWAFVLQSRGVKKCCRLFESSCQVQFFFVTRVF